MTTVISPNVPLGPEKEIHAELERVFIDEYLKHRGYTSDRLNKLPETEAHQIMSEASTYASGKLAEIESREHTRQNLKGIGHNEVF